MSYQYGQYSTGFDLMRPSYQALVFEDAVQLRGEEVSIFTLKPVGSNSYGHVIYSEVSMTGKAFISRDPRDTRGKPGEVKLGDIEALFVEWAPLDELLTRVEVDGKRYRVIGIDRTTAYARVLLTREVEIG